MPSQACPLVFHRQTRARAPVPRLAFHLPTHVPIARATRFFFFSRMLIFERSIALALAHYLCGCTDARDWVGGAAVVRRGQHQQIYRDQLQRGAMKLLAVQLGLGSSSAGDRGMCTYAKTCNFRASQTCGARARVLPCRLSSRNVVAVVR